MITRIVVSECVSGLRCVLALTPRWPTRRRRDGPRHSRDPCGAVAHAVQGSFGATRGPCSRPLLVKLAVSGRNPSGPLCQHEVTDRAVVASAHSRDRRASLFGEGACCGPDPYRAEGVGKGSSARS